VPGCVVTIHGRLDLGVKAIRDTQVYSASRGMDRKKYRIIAFRVAAVLTGLSGGVCAAHFRFAGPSLFGFSTLMFGLSLALVGGLGATWGPLIGTGVMMMMVVVGLSREMDDARNPILGLALIHFLALLPTGQAFFSHLPRSLCSASQTAVTTTGTEMATSVVCGRVGER